ncbi:hypothetical protein BDI4_70080 [Burkholderia diffusa]|nr:hypothetical protein BDI4_70080 [Burkholderia diffusa]
MGGREVRRQACFAWRRFRRGGQFRMGLRPEGSEDSGCRAPFARDGFGAGARWWPVGAATL